ncbi:hypothetical protein YC2023_015702 [Brassica napus]
MNLVRYFLENPVTQKNKLTLTLTCLTLQDNLLVKNTTEPNSNVFKGLGKSYIDTENRLLLPQMTHLSFHNHRRKPPRLLHYHLRFQFRLSWLHPFHSIGKKLPPDPLDQPLYGCEAETSSDCFSSVPISGAFTVDEFDDNLNRETSSMPTSPA